MTRYFAAAAAATLLLAGCNTYNDGESISLDSTAPGVEWQIRPYDDLKEFSGEEISMPGFDMGEYVRGVVPGTVFTAYVEAGKEEKRGRSRLRGQYLPRGRDFLQQTVLVQDVF